MDVVSYAFHHDPSKQNKSIAKQKLKNKNQEKVTTKQTQNGPHTSLFYQLTI